MLKRFLKSTTGTASIEYAIIASVIGVAVLAGVTTLGEENQQSYNEISATVTDATN